MSKEPKENRLSSDQAVIDPNKDRLGHAVFAKYLADTIAEMVPEDGIVLGIYAPWGDGKTTLLNFIQHYLNEKSEEDRPIVVPFNPWWFSGQEDLVLSFFQQLLRILNKDNRLGKKTRKAVEKYAEFIGQGVGTVASLAGAAHGIPIPPNAGTFLTGGLKTFAPNEKPISDLKADVETALRARETKLLVIIDDIDRLTAEETRQMFRVVKAVADFPNVIYLLTFDRVVVAKALKTVQEGDGNDYLEKIIQVPFELPLPARTALDQMFFGKLDTILGLDKDGEEDRLLSTLFDADYWRNIYVDGIRHFLDTPRDIVRLTNTLTVTYPSVRNEVNPVDFIAIECLRVFAPTVYNVIRQRPDMFVGAGTVPDYEKKQYKSFHDEWFNAMESSFQEPVKYLVSHLFPKTNAAWLDKWFSGDNTSSWGERRRIAHGDIFPIFFRLTVPEGEISNLKMHQALESASNTVDFTNLLLDYQKTLRPDGVSYARRFLERLEDFTDTILPKSVIPSVLHAVFDAGDRLIGDEPETKRSFFDWGISISIKRIIHQLLKRLSEEERFEVLNSIVNTTDSYYTIIDNLVIWGQQHGKFSGREDKYEQTFTLEHLQVLEQSAINKLRNRVQIEHFEKSSINLRRVLAVWLEVGSSEEAGKWLIDMMRTDEGLLKVLVAFLATDRLDPFWFKPFLDPSSLRERIEKLSHIDLLPPKQRLAVLEFLQEYADRDAGHSPEDIHYAPGSSVFDQMKLDKLSLINKAQTPATT